MSGIRLLYEDPWFVAVHKPERMLVHRSPLDRHETRFALQEARNLVGRRLYPLHRLDRPTSGVLLFAAEREAAREGFTLFREGLVEKTYFAVVRGWIPESGVIDSPLADDLGGLRGENPAPQRVREAVTEFRRLAAVEIPFAVSKHPTTRYSLAEIHPLTGRRRQIRRHFKHFFHPLIGDTTYGEGRHNRFFREQFGCSRLLLAAVRLALPHPFTGERLDIFCPPDESFLHILRELQCEEAALPSPTSSTVLPSRIL
jgi:tRNA pseudouridine65 synthase